MGQDDGTKLVRNDPFEIPFPFQPYPAQKTLMQQLYRTFEEGHVGLFESPTGTGKSLSLICASLFWLRDRQRKDDAGEADPAMTNRLAGHAGSGASSSASMTSSEPDWLRDFGVEKRQVEEEKKRQVIKERRAALRLRLHDARQKSHRLDAIVRALKEKEEGENERGKNKKKKMKEAQAQGKKEQKKKNEKREGEEDEDDDLIPADYESGKEDDSDDDRLWSNSDDDDDDENDEKAGAGKEIEEEGAGQDDEGDDLDRATTKILYCSRTHSQVSQFVMEIEKTAFQEDVRVISLSSRKNLCVNEEVLRLGSDGRISDRCLDMQKGKAKVAAAAAAAAAASPTLSEDKEPQEKRTDAQALKRQRVQRNSTTTEAKKCPFLQGTSLPQRQALFRDHALSRVRNLEDLAELGTRLGTCPYYGTRRAVAQAELICMPYATLLHKQTRESMKIPLKGNVVLIDEAHNLVEAINAVHTNQLSLQAMNRALGQVTLYWERYNTRLSGKNSFYVQQIIRILKGLVEFVRNKVMLVSKASSVATSSTSAAAVGTNTATTTTTTTPSTSKSDAGKRKEGQQRASPSSAGDSRCSSLNNSSAHSSMVLSVNELLFESGMDNVNIFKVVRYMEQSQISKKVLGFAERRLGEVQIFQLPAATGISAQRQEEGEGAGGGNEEEYVSTHVSSMQLVESFLTTLTGSSKDGRIVLETGLGPQKGRRRPAAGLKYIMLNAAVHFKEIVEEARSVILIGGTLQPVAPIVSQLFPHLPPNRIDVFSCGHVIPPENLTALCVTKGPTGLDFDFTHKSRGLATQMDELGRLLLNVCRVTPGGVVVFLPSYQYEETIFHRWHETGIFTKLQAIKPLLTEPKRAKDVDSVLQSYAQAIRTGGGALLFCVVGAKMSEGINFANEMARCVVMVGLPYPDSRDPELQQKLQYLDGLRSEASVVFGSVNGKAYYQNLCMRAVNQSIGRAIRHANDWAAILLVDRRYFIDPSIIPLLPKWIADRVVPYQQSSEFGRAFMHLTRFFRVKAAATASAT